MNNPLYNPRGNKCNNCHQVLVDGGGLKSGNWKEMKVTTIIVAVVDGRGLKFGKWRVTTIIMVQPDTHSFNVSCKI